MKELKIQGGKKLAGTITISGAKNSTVALIPAAIMADGPVILEGVPAIQDVVALKKILRLMGVKVSQAGDQLTIDPREMVSIPMPTGEINSLRASYYFMGALLGKFGEAVVGLPGGCNLGPRPIDLHMKGFEALGVEMTTEHGATYLRTPAKKMQGSRIFMDTVSVGATINVMLAAVKAEGRTIIENAAREPEIIDVATLLNNMGAKVRGAGTAEIRIEGVSRLQGCRHSIIPDRIEAGTYLSLAVAMGGGIRVQNVIHEHLESFLAKLEEVGARLLIEEDAVEVLGHDQFEPINVTTYPYPGFATDLQQPLVALLTQVPGESVVVDTIYPKRVNHLPQLARMGAKVKQVGNMVMIEGPTKLKGTTVVASDLRAGACLVIAGLCAEGTTTIQGVEHILRGYDHIVEKLQALGAAIEMVENNQSEGER